MSLHFQEQETKKQRSEGLMGPEAITKKPTQQALGVENPKGRQTSNLWRRGVEVSCLCGETSAVFCFS